MLKLNLNGAECVQLNQYSSLVMLKSIVCNGQNKAHRHKRKNMGKKLSSCRVLFCSLDLYLSAPSQYMALACAFHTFQMGTGAHPERSTERALEHNQPNRGAPSGARCMRAGIISLIIRSAIKYTRQRANARACT